MKHPVLSILFLLAAALDSRSQDVVAYPVPDYAQSSTDFSGVTVGDKVVFVEKFQDYQYAHFAFSAPGECVATAKEKIETWAIQPLRRGIKGQVEGNALRFTLSHQGAKPGYFVVQVNKLGRLVIL